MNNEAAPIPSPFDTTLATANRRQMAPWFIFLVVIAAIPVVVSFMIQDGRDECRVFSAFTFLITVLVYFKYRGLDKELTSDLRSPWLHWQYTPEQWSAWTDQQVARFVQTHRVTARGRWIASAILAAILDLELRSRMAPDVWRWALAASVPLTALIAILWGFQNRTAPARYRRRLQQAAPYAIFGPMGLFIANQYFRWHEKEMFLLSAAPDEKAPWCLCFTFRTVTQTRQGKETEDTSILVAIPVRAQGDLASLQSRLTALCPETPVSLLESPPVPADNAPATDVKGDLQTLNL